MKVKLLSRIQLFVTPWTVAYQAAPSMGFSRQEYWSGLPLPSLGDLPDPGIEPVFLTSPALAGTFLTTRATWEAPISHRPRFHSTRLHQTIISSNSKLFACVLLFQEEPVCHAHSVSMGPSTATLE